MLEEVEPQKSLQRVRGGCLESQLTLKAAIETYKIRVAVAVPPLKKRKRVLTKHCVKYTDCWQQDASSRSHRPSAALHARHWLSSSLCSAPKSSSPSPSPSPYGTAR